MLEKRKYTNSDSYGSGGNKLTNSDSRENMLTIVVASRRKNTTISWMQKYKVPPQEEYAGQYEWKMVSFGRSLCSISANPFRWQASFRALAVLYQHSSSWRHSNATSHNSSDGCWDLMLSKINTSHFQWSYFGHPFGVRSVHPWALHVWVCQYECGCVGMRVLKLRDTLLVGNASNKSGMRPEQ